VQAELDFAPHASGDDGVPVMGVFGDLIGRR
jgi:hypothetical protein